MDPRFFRNYLDILTEAPTPTEKQAVDLETGSDKVTRGADTFSQGNYASGAMDVARGANDIANAAGMSFGDKMSAVGMGVKAAGSAGMAYLRGKDPVASATGSVGKNLTQPMANVTNDPNFEKDFKAGMDSARTNSNTDPKVKQMAADAAAGNLSADSMKGYANRMQNKFDKMSSGDAVDDAFDDSPYIQHSGLKTADTTELDPMKTQAVTGQLKPVEYKPAPVQEELDRIKQLIRK
jgi:hypothetical protein